MQTDPTQNSRYLESLEILAQTTGPVPVTITPGETVEYPSDTLSTSSSFLGIDWISILLWIVLILIIGGGAWGAGYLYMNFLKKKDRDDKSKDGVLFEVQVPRENETEAGVAEKMFANLYGVGGKGKGLAEHVTVKNAISFEIVAIPGEIRFYVYAPRNLAGLVEKQILGSYQDAQVKVVDEHNIFSEGSKVSFAALEQTDEAYYPIKVNEDFTGDPMANILSTIAKMEEGEGALIQFVLSPSGGDWQKGGNKYVQKVESNNADPEKKRINVSQEQLQAIGKKTSKVGFEAAIRVVTTAQNDELAKMHRDSVVGAFEQYSNPGINGLKKVDIKKFKEREFMNDVVFRRLPIGKNSVFNVEELAGMYHFPNKEVNTPNIHWLLSKDVPAANEISSDIESKDTIWLGNNEFRGTKKPICFQRDDRRRHMYIVGQTGSGKSWMLTRMIMQDIYNGDGVCFLDPHGSTAEMVLERIPHERAEDVVYFDASDFDRPFGLNLMDFQTEQDKHRVVNGFIGMLKKLFDPNNQGIVGPILERAVRNAMLTAMSEKGSSLVEVVRILTDEQWVKDKWIPLIKDDLVKRYWTDQMAKTSDHQKSETLGYIVSKFDRFVTNKAIRNIVGQTESSFNMRDIMDNKKILIVNLSKGLLGEENAQFLGTLLIPKILSAALSREDIPEEERKDFFFYVDEFQNFATEEFTSILSEARKYRLNLTMANQYIGQMPETIKDAIFGNVGSIMVGRVGSEDAQFLESQFEPTLTANDLINQGNVHYFLKMISDGRYPTPFSLEPGYGPAFPDSGFDLPVNTEVSDMIKQLSRLRYGRDVKIVEEEITKRADLEVKDDKKVGGAPPPLSLK